MSGAGTGRLGVTAAPPTTPRRATPDVVRALALGGVILMNYHGYLILRGGTRRSGWLSDVFDPWTGVFSARFATTFVVVAGMGVTLMTRSAIGDPARVAALRWRLASRGVVLYAFGLGFDFVWPGTILPFYGAMFALAALVFTLRTRWVVLAGVASVVAAAAIAWWQVDRRLGGHSTAWLTDPGPRSPRGLLLDLAVNGTHPLLPWFAFFCAGIVAGRALDAAWFTRACIGAGLALVAGAALIRTAAIDAGTSARARVLLSTDPFDRSPLFVAASLGVALVAVGAIGWVAERHRSHPVIDALRRAGQLSLSVYVLHALVFLLLVDTLEWISPGGIATALPLAIVVWLLGTVAAAAWHRHLGRGPFERLYRGLTA